MKKNPIVESLRPFFKGSPLRIFGRLLFALLILTGFVCIIYYILGPARGYFHSDCVDTLYWAYTSVESGLPLNPDFGYAAILPFGSQIWLVPLIAIFGMKYSTYVAGTIIFALVYFAALLFLSRRLELTGGWRMMFVTGMLFLLSGSEKLREMMWEHAIYYSLSILFFVLGSALVLSYLKRNFKWPTMVLLAVLTAGVAIDGAQMIALYLIPLLGAAALERFFSTEAGLREPRTKRTFSLAVIMISTTAIGLGVLYVLTDFGEIGAGYANAYSTYSGSEEWLENLLGVLPNLMSLFGIVIEGGSSIVSVDTVPLMIKMCGLLILLLIPFAMFAVYRKIEDVALRFFLWAHALTSIIILFTVTIGSLGGVNWRLIPILGTAVPTTILSLKWIFDEGDAKIKKTREASVDQHKLVRKPLLWFMSSVRKRFATVCLMMIFLNVILTAQGIFRMPSDYDRDNNLHVLTDFLKEHQLEYGYSDFWRSQGITVLSDNEVRIRCIAITTSGIQKRTYQNDMKWFEDQPGVDRYFVLLTQSEYGGVVLLPNWEVLEPLLDEVLEVETGHIVLVFRDNPWKYLE
ncbi:MAG: hypothetical protein PHP22_07810 [Oscillospiraceae bacterium]|nr:hypothetical protein [Oscillospiraceae bacterium]